MELISISAPVMILINVLFPVPVEPTQITQLFLGFSFVGSSCFFGSSCINSETASSSRGASALKDVFDATTPASTTPAMPKYTKCLFSSSSSCVKINEKMLNAFLLTTFFSWWYSRLEELLLTNVAIAAWELEAKKESLDFLKF